MRLRIKRVGQNADGTINLAGRRVFLRAGAPSGGMLADYVLNGAGVAEVQNKDEAKWLLSHLPFTLEVDDTDESPALVLPVEGFVPPPGFKRTPAAKK